MRESKKLFTKFAKYTVVTLAAVGILIIALFSMTVEKVEIGGYCGTYVKKQNWYNDTGCTCLGRLIVEKEDNGFIDYRCKGIKLYHGYE